MATTPTPPDPNGIDFDHLAEPMRSGVSWGTGATQMLERPVAERDPINRPSHPGGPASHFLSPSTPHGGLSSHETTPSPEGRYLVGKEIGRGGVGVVHEAWDLQLQRQIAVKVLLEEHRVRPKVVQRFLQEARITSRLQHPGIVAIHEVGASPDGRPLFFMRLVRGDTLEQILSCCEERASNLPRLLAIFLQIGQAVAYAHSQGVIHRDLKPANIMVGAFGVVKVMDWGLAKVLGQPDVLDADTAAQGAADFAEKTRSATDSNGPATEVGTVFGTPAYLPPEQARSEIDRIKKQSDVFGLGAILCEILTGHPPYTGADSKKVYHMAATADIADAFARVDASPAALDLLSLTKWCLSPEPEDRPADAATVVEVMTVHLQAGQRRAEQDLVRFFELSQDLFCIASMDGYFLRVNENFSQVLGHSALGLTSRPFLEFVHPDDQDRTLAEVERLSSGALTIQFTNRYRHAGGHFLWLEWSASPVLEERAIYAVARNVTDRVVQMEAHHRTEALYRAMVETALDAIITIDPAGTIQTLNRAAERMFGYTQAELLGRNLNVLMPPPYCERHDNYLANYMRTGLTKIIGSTVEVAGQRKDGSVFPVELSVSEIREAGIHLFTGVLREISTRQHVGILQRLEDMGPGAGAANPKNG